MDIDEISEFILAYSKERKELKDHRLVRDPVMQALIESHRARSGADAFPEDLLPADEVIWVIDVFHQALIPDHMLKPKDSPWQQWGITEGFLGAARSSLQRHGAVRLSRLANCPETLERAAERIGDVAILAEAISQQTHGDPNSAEITAFAERLAGQFIYEDKSIRSVKTLSTWFRGGIKAIVEVMLGAVPQMNVEAGPRVVDSSYRALDQQVQTKLCKCKSDYDKQWVMRLASMMAVVQLKLEPAPDGADQLQLVHLHTALRKIGVEPLSDLAHQLVHGLESAGFFAGYRDQWVCSDAPMLDFLAAQLVARAPGQYVSLHPAHQPTMQCAAWTLARDGHLPQIEQFARALARATAGWHITTLCDVAVVVAELKAYWLTPAVAPLREALRDSYVAMAHFPSGQVQTALLSASAALELDVPGLDPLAAPEAVVDKMLLTSASTQVPAEELLLRLGLAADLNDAHWFEERAAIERLVQGLLNERDSVQLACAGWLWHASLTARVGLVVNLKRFSLNRQSAWEVVADVAADATADPTARALACGILCRKDLLEALASRGTDYEPLLSAMLLATRSRIRWQGDTPYVCDAGKRVRSE